MNSSAFRLKAHLLPVNEVNKKVLKMNYFTSTAIKTHKISPYLRGWKEPSTSSVEEERKEEVKQEKTEKEVEEEKGKEKDN